jgi:hypothetical protein
MPSIGGRLKIIFAPTKINARPIPLTFHMMLDRHNQSIAASLSSISARLQSWSATSAAIAGLVGPPALLDSVTCGRQILDFGSWVTGAEGLDRGDRHAQDFSHLAHERSSPRLSKDFRFDDEI